MANPNVNTSFPVAGKLAHSCDDLSASYPYGGTGMGQVSTVYFQPPDGVIRLPREEDNASDTLIYVGGDAVLGVTLEGWESDALQAVFPNFTLSNGEVLIDWGGGDDVVPGADMPGLSPLVFAPLPGLASEAPAVILYDARVDLEATRRLWLSSYRFLGISLVFVGVPDASDRSAQMGVLGELSL